MLTSIEIFSQSRQIIGTVISHAEDPLSGAHILVNEELGAFTDGNGQFLLEIEDSLDSISIYISMLGYEPIDTLVASRSSKTYIDFYMRPMSYVQDEVVVKGSVRQDLFHRTDWVILDLITQGSTIFVLHLEGRSRYISVYSANGILQEQVEVDGEFSCFKRACTGSIYLEGKEHYLKIRNEVNDPILTEKGRMKEYLKVISPCALKLNNHYVFKSFTAHNKIVDYFYYSKQKKQELLLSIKDEERRKVAQSYYSDIIRMYYLASYSPEEGAIDEGFERENIISNGEWTGDLKDLAITNDLLFAVGYYLQIENQPISTLEFKNGKQGVVLDFVNEKGYRIDPHTLNLEHLEICTSMEWRKMNSHQVIYDVLNEKVYVMNDQKELYRIVLEQNELCMTFILALDDNANFPKHFEIIGDQLFYIDQPDRTLPYSKMNVVDIEIGN